MRFECPGESGGPTEATRGRGGKRLCQMGPLTLVRFAPLAPGQLLESGAGFTFVR
jgi:hypothetical protein